MLQPEIVQKTHVVFTWFHAGFISFCTDSDTDMKQGAVVVEEVVNNPLMAAGGGTKEVAGPVVKARAVAKVLVRTFFAVCHHPRRE